MASFPSIYAMVGTKGARVEELWEPAGVEGSWNLRLERLFYAWELEEIQRFISTVGKNSISLRSTDSLIWKGAQNGSYSIKSGYALMEGNSETFLRAPIKMLWNPNSLLKSASLLGKFCGARF